MLDSARLRAVQALIAERCAESLSLDKLARRGRMSRYHFVRHFSRAVGMTPHAWQIDQRIERVRALLEQGMSLADAALQLGFADQSHFQRAFKRRVAATPGEYRQVAGSSFLNRAISFNTHRSPNCHPAPISRVENGMALWQQFLVIAGRISSPC